MAAGSRGNRRLPSGPAVQADGQWWDRISPPERRTRDQNNLQAAGELEQELRGLTRARAPPPRSFRRARAWASSGVQESLEAEADPGGLGHVTALQRRGHVTALQRRCPVSFRCQRCSVLPFLLRPKVVQRLWRLAEEALHPDGQPAAPAAGGPGLPTPHPPQAQAPRPSSDTLRVFGTVRVTQACWAAECVF